KRDSSNGAEAKAVPATGLNGSALPLVDSVVSSSLATRVRGSARLRLRRQPMQSRAKAGHMDAVGREIRHAARRLVRSRAFTLAAVLTLALATGATAATFTAVYRVR